MNFPQFSSLLEKKGGNLGGGRGEVVHLFLELRTKWGTKWGRFYFFNA